ncbi:MAG: thioredoxin family protein [Alphaproteobacteria bacterium]|nr:thioredoxin family protein [Alphaproteobacteria bacterium]
MKKIRQHLSRRGMLTAIAAGAAGLMGAQIAHAAKDRYKPVQLENGQYTQSWFLNSFLELPDDMEEAKSNGKRFAILWEQEGCPYCRETHLTNLAIPKISDYIRANFDILQLDIWGGREIVDFDGMGMTEKTLAKRSQVRFTPTIQFFPNAFSGATPPVGKKAEVVRMPGYFRPFHFLSMFEYVRANGYEHAPFYKYLGKKVAGLKATGKGIPQW